MAVQTPIANSLNTSVVGSLRMEITRFTSVSDADTYVSGLTNIIGFSADGSTSAPTIAATWSGATVTFKVTTGPALLVSLVLFGTN